MSGGPPLNEAYVGSYARMCRSEWRKGSVTGEISSGRRTIIRAGGPLSGLCHHSRNAPAGTLGGAVRLLEDVAVGTRDGAQRNAVRLAGSTRRCSLEIETTVRTVPSPEPSTDTHALNTNAPKIP